MLEIDAVIDPADTRKWLVGALEASLTSPEASAGMAIDTW